MAEDWQAGVLKAVRDELQEALDLEVEPDRFELEMLPAKHREDDPRVDIFDLKHHLYDGEPQSEELPETLAFIHLLDPVQRKVGLEILRPDMGYWGPYRFKQVTTLDEVSAILVALLGQLESGEEYVLDPDLWHEGQNWDWEEGKVIH